MATAKGTMGTQRSSSGRPCHTSVHFLEPPVRIRCAVASDAVWRCMEEGLIDWCSMIAEAGIDAGFASVGGACDGLIEQAAQQVPAPVWVSVAET